MKKLNPLVVEKSYKYGAYLLSGLLLFSLFQIPTMSPAISESSESQSILARTIAPASVSAGEITSDRQALALNDTFFGREVSPTVAKATVEKQIDFVSSRKAYPPSLAVIQKHEKTIKAKAKKYNVPEDVAIGVGLLENGGSETAVSKAGALGVFQLMPGTARSLGLRVDKNVDQRKNVELNIDAGVRYLRNNYDRFGDWGLATWAYHAGEGNVSNAVKIYAKVNNKVNLVGVKNASQMRAYVEKHNLTVHKLLSDPAVKQFTKKLNDDSSGYPYKVLATAALFKEAAKAKELVVR
jgi:soluble lytic murein transglycosylase-like protein